MQVQLLFDFQWIQRLYKNLLYLMFSFAEQHILTFSGYILSLLSLVHKQDSRPITIKWNTTPEISVRMRVNRMCSNRKFSKIFMIAVTRKIPWRYVKKQTSLKSIHGHKKFARKLSKQNTALNRKLQYEFSAGIPVISNAEILSLLLLHVLACSNYA